MEHTRPMHGRSSLLTLVVFKHLPQIPNMVNVNINTPNKISETPVLGTRQRDPRPLQSPSIRWLAVDVSILLQHTPSELDIILEHLNQVKTKH